MRPSSGHSIRYVAVPGNDQIMIIHSQQKVLVLTFEDSATPPNRVRNVSLSLDNIGQIPKRQVIPPVTIFCEDILELLRQEAPFVVIRARITPVLCLMRIYKVKTKKRIRKPAWACRVREVDMDDQDCDEGQDHVEAQTVEPDECVLRPENPVVVAIEKVAVLLDHALMRVFPRPIVLCAAFRLLRRGCEVRTRGACYLC